MVPYMRNFPSSSLAQGQIAFHPLRVQRTVPIVLGYWISFLLKGIPTKSLRLSRDKSHSSGALGPMQTVARGRGDQDSLGSIYSPHPF